MALITNFKQIFDVENAPLKGFAKGHGIKIPSLKSDYVIGIMPEYKANTNASDFEGMLVTRMGNEYLSDGFAMEKNIWGITNANLKFSNNFTFSYIGWVVNDEDEFTRYNVNVYADSSRDEVLYTRNETVSRKSKYPSLIHKYYYKQLTGEGTLRIKTQDWKLPAIYIYDLRKQTPIFALIDCKFTLPTFDVDPNNNDIVIYSTTAYYNSFMDLQHFAELQVTDIVATGYSETEEFEDTLDYTYTASKGISFIK